ncbi:MAG: hypothetical protein EP339_09065 [Gammaproteobacteria bacterium]|uniref:Uncharacterized protein n=1 Tax=Marinobacter nitratireducens TaxID=1137280 RepID=A0A072NIC7_9GAMM|nr:hypothetical protein [Marinobacter nitratireducens]KEF32920.1 hypothetical protein D777_00482 [Marinobacter nitratireducens]TNE75474.1 MAG: hypothetical protein EP339_09065 [Gammaproteobacteria bacterium]TNE96052.1 MAG: hypothetical protein EP328_08795 [Gammaproteobacteria bacterium]
MLKELWRKLGADFLQSHYSSHSGGGAFSSRESGKYGEFRILPHITHTGEFHLERLTNLLHARYGKKFEAKDIRAASDDAIRDLIGFAVRIQDQDVQRELLLFYLNCSPVIQEFLRSETLLGDGHLLSR